VCSAHHIRNVGLFFLSQFLSSSSFFFYFFFSGQRRLRQMSTWKFWCKLCDVFFFLFLACAIACVGVCACAS
jgi:hypothetical protein